MRSSSDAMTVLVASSGFRKTLGPGGAAAAIEEGIQAESPMARVVRIPVIDGGDGFAEEIVQACAGSIERLRIRDPYGRSVTARLGLIGGASDRTAIIGIDEATDLRNLPADCRDTTRVSSRGVGQLIRAAMERGVSRIVIGCGRSGVNDGGIGMATELGIRFFDANRSEIVEAGGLQRLASIDLSKMDRRLRDITIEAVVDPLDLLGEIGVIPLAGQTPGAAQSQVRRMERGIARYIEVIARVLGIDVRTLPGGGASGGLGAGLVTFAGARLIPRLDFLQNSTGLDRSFAAADLAITAADEVDGFSRAGDVAQWFTGKARSLGLPVIALQGAKARPVPEASDSNDPVAPVTRKRERENQRATGTGEWLRDASARAMRTALLDLGRCTDADGELTGCRLREKVKESRLPPGRSATA